MFSAVQLEYWALVDRAAHMPQKENDFFFVKYTDAINSPRKWMNNLRYKYK